VFLYAFDLIELNGDDLRRDPLEVRKATLASTAPACRGTAPFSARRFKLNDAHIEPDPILEERTHLRPPAPWQALDIARSGHN
jgi:hypothetical protein